MVIISKTIVQAFSRKHGDAAAALNSWYKIVAQADWGNFNQARNDFNSVDAVGNDRYVFNIRGNTYRLVALIHFDIRTVYIRFIGTHPEYDRIDPSKI